jgi:truncated hemoglobin YjbI
MSYFEQIGGTFALSAIIDEFVERVCGDTMIGFLFAKVDKARLKQMEFEHAAVFLGGAVSYTGRDLERAHARHPILGGHFARRRTILEQTLTRHGVPAEITAAWLAHQDALRPLITKDDVTQCTDVRYIDEKGEGKS